MDLPFGIKMNKEELSPEQLQEFKQAMKDARANTNEILAYNLFLLVCLTFMGFALTKYFGVSSSFRFATYFMTTVLVVSSTNKSLIEESDRFREEANKILNQ